MRFPVLLGLLAVLLAAGCVQMPSTSPTNQPPTTPVQVCRNVTTVTPVTQLECGNVSYTVPVCQLRTLNYTSTRNPNVDLCIGDGPCTGSPLSQCQTCSQAMTRCVMVIRNNEPVESGTWSVAANFTLGSAGFIKDPITETIPPNGSFAFDFSQIYTVGNPINSAVCNLWIVKEPTIQDCHQETRTRVDCNNVTTNTSSTSQVCD